MPKLVNPPHSLFRWMALLSTTFTKPDLRAFLSTSLSLIFTQLTFYLTFESGPSVPAIIFSLTSPAFWLSPVCPALLLSQFYTLLLWSGCQIPDTLMQLWNLTCHGPRCRPTAHIFNTLCSFLALLPRSAVSLFCLTFVHPSSHSLSLTSAPLAWSALAPHTPPAARCSSREPSSHCLVKNGFFSLVSFTSLKFQTEYTPSWSSRDPLPQSRHVADTK